MSAGKQGFMDRFKNRSRPGKPWLLIMAGAVLVGCFIALFVLMQTGTNPAIKGKARTTAMRNNVESTPGGNATKAYREKVGELNRIEAENAEKGGQSFVPSVAGQISEEEPIKKEDLQQQEQKPQEKQEPKRAAWENQGGSIDPDNRMMERKMREMEERIQRLQQQRGQQQTTQYRQEDNQEAEQYARQYSKQLSQINAEMDQHYTGQEIIDFEEINEAGQVMEASATGSVQPGDSPKQMTEDFEEEMSLKPGDILYARNEIMLNSDALGPAQATILAGEFQGAKLIGGFDKSNDYLTVEFSRMILPDGTMYQIDGVAIDPEVQASAVRSDVDRHILTRWGGLMAASFLAGFGEAVSDSGTEIAVSDGTTVSSTPDLDTEEELWSAAGRVGEELSTVLNRNFDRPNTITLDPGIEIGILILQAEKEERIR